MISISTITLKSAHPRETARFWRDLLGYGVAANHSDSVLLTGNGPSLLIQPSARPPEHGAIHLDLRPDDRSAAVAHALGLGARLVDVGQEGDEGWTVMQDPTGNLFCILDSLAVETSRQDGPGAPTSID